MLASHLPSTWHSPRPHALEPSQLPAIFVGLATLVLFADYLDSIRLDRAGVPSPILAPIGQEVTIVNFSSGVNNGRGQLTIVG